MKVSKLRDLNRRSAITDHMVLFGFGLAVVYWLLDSFLSIFLSYEHFLEKLLDIELDNVWGRVIVLCMFVDIRGFFTVRGYKSLGVESAE